MALPQCRMPETPPSKYRAPALDKGLDILEWLARQDAPQSMGEVSEGIGRSRNEIFRMLQVLEERGYVARAQGDAGYQLSNRLFMLGLHQPQVQNVAEVALPVMRGLADAIRQPCHLVAPSEDQIVVILQVDVPRDFGLVVRPGYRRPLAHSASGLALFAFQQPDVQAQWLRVLDAADAPYERDAFIASARAVRERGHVVRPSDAVVGVTDLTAPILQHGHATYALTVPYIQRVADPLDMDASLRAVCAAADAITHALAHDPPRR